MHVFEKLGLLVGQSETLSFYNLKGAYDSPLDLVFLCWMSSFHETLKRRPDTRPISGKGQLGGWTGAVHGRAGAVMWLGRGSDA